MIACELLNIDDIDEIADSLPADEEDRYTFLASLSEKVVKLARPQVDTQSIRQVLVAAGDEHTDDEGHSSDDTILYWDNGQELEDTLPYYESDEFGQK